MNQTQHYKIGQFLRQASAKLSISPARVVERCGLPRDFLQNEGNGVDAKTWFRVTDALVNETNNLDLPLLLGRAAANGPFQPALLAFSSSSDIRTGLERLKIFKPLMTPINLVLSEGNSTYSVKFQPFVGGSDVFGATAAAEIAYFVEIMRSFTAYAIIPHAVTLPDMHFATPALETYVGCPIHKGLEASFTISLEDSYRTLISADTAFYAVVERELLARLDLGKTSHKISDRVRSTLIDILPSGQISVEKVCDYLGTSKRSLQRKLKDENTSFQGVLDETRASLALTYIRDQNLSVEEISHLLAYKDANSFYRAFQSWTGMTPAQARTARSD